MNPHNIQQFFSVFNSLIQTQYTRSFKVFLNGDWIFENSILGLMSPNSFYPCPICTVHKDCFLSCFRTSFLRSETTQYYPNTCYSQKNSPLIHIHSSFIVPSPLHVFLGIGNRIIDILKEWINNKKLFEKELSTIKTLHAPGNTGSSDLYGLNGQEIKKFLNKKIDVKLIEQGNLDENKIKKIRKLFSWLRGLQHYLLETTIVNENSFSSFQTLILDIWKYWQSTSEDTVFPKLHLLMHNYHFMKEHKILSQVSEQQLEAYHSQFNTKYWKHHNNIKEIPKRLKRSLADLTLKTLKESKPKRQKKA